MAVCQLLNDLIDISGLNELFPAYSNLSENLVAGQPVWLQFLTIGILAPVAEELVFRGLIFARLKEWMKPWLAMILSALIFGVYHGNIVQFVYAFFMGLILALIYYRTGTLLTCIAAHVVANLWSLFGYTWMSRWIHGLPLGVLVGIIIELLLCVIPGYWLVADRRKNKANNTAS
ncbi:MAG: CPBP family intramembrane metalloprotease [Eubacterium sp.]|nr:CPBP family intramembrane metalloprotease [Eubacterium sp.]